MAVCLARDAPERRKMLQLLREHVEISLAVIHYAYEYERMFCLRMLQPLDLIIPPFALYGDAFTCHDFESVPALLALAALKELAGGAELLALEFHLLHGDFREDALSHRYPRVAAVYLYGAQCLPRNNIAFAQHLGKQPQIIPVLRLQHNDIVAQILLQYPHEN